jgi:hypothetical protein
MEPSLDDSRVKVENFGRIYRFEWLYASGRLRSMIYGHG